MLSRRARHNNSRLKRAPFCAGLRACAERRRALGLGRGRAWQLAWQRLLDWRSARKHAALGQARRQLLTHRRCAPTRQAQPASQPTLKIRVPRLRAQSASNEQFATSILCQNPRPLNLFNIIFFIIIIFTGNVFYF